MNQFRDIIFRLFDKIPILSDWAVEKHKEYAISYLDTKDINFTAIFANKLASLATTESNVNIVGDNRRSEILDEMLQRMWDKSKGITAQALGTGGVILLPYSSGGKIYTDIVSQDRFAINSMAGDDIKEATILADMTERNRIRYYRYTDYSIDGNTYIIRNKATRDSSSVPLDSVLNGRGSRRKFVLPTLIECYLRICGAPLITVTMILVTAYPSPTGARKLFPKSWIAYSKLIWSISVSRCL